MTDTEATDHLEDAHEMLRGASQILQALAESPDCVGGGECLALAGGCDRRRLRPHRCGEGCHRLVRRSYTLATRIFTRLANRDRTPSRSDLPPGLALRETVKPEIPTNIR